MKRERERERERREKEREREREREREAERERDEVGRRGVELPFQRVRSCHRRSPRLHSDQD
jgi:hypothetical protein